MDDWLKVWHRGAELQAYTAKELHEMLAARGYVLTGRRWKQDYKQAIMYVEGLPVLPVIVERLGLVRLEPVAG